MSDNKQHATILVVDDMSDNVVILSLALQDMGYRVITAVDGEEATKVASAARPDLILMDIAMPNLDGMAATRQIRKHEDLQNVPIVACTAFDTAGFRQAAYDAGFDGYLTKPIDFERLGNLVTMLLSKEEERSVAAEGQASSRVSATSVMTPVKKAS
ncbi:MAG: response regulator [Acidobacteriota bacterium]|nr:response regulator [Acidobacteriota bacterium]